MWSCLKPLTSDLGVFSRAAEILCQRNTAEKNQQLLENLIQLCSNNKQTATVTTSVRDFGGIHFFGVRGDCYYCSNVKVKSSKVIL